MAGRERRGAVPDASAAQSDCVDDEARTTHKGARKRTLRHGPIRYLGMGAMTMVFDVKDPRNPRPRQAGDRILFEDQQTSGQIVTAEAAPAK